ncbi:DUF6494 family protein [Alkalilimnicola ehrlichii MLHE-1]|uniref:Uncharacterized protein n=1 Tax=Alkalilimnicola ehrlichii (strain ATCC BAA-1101 / DSM 17681 / MLHE-1) TaxID=187272 RepID=Q0A959_ALKEH|nr:DUF6494 family protein [Alkalilimnicola ehrlichii]ABI56628.1 conserved hypothetical protein [Alkalilimnicola ehrlichii MLHE-1]
MLDEDALNQQIRKFLKQVGVTSQHEIERAVRAGLENGSLKPGDTLRAKVRLTVDGAGVDHEVAADLELKG